MLGKAPVRVTLIDRKNHHTFQPLLYQVATAGLSPGEIAMPIRAILGGHKNTEVLLGEVTGVDLDMRRVLLEDSSVQYDYLILATGATHAYFGNDQWAPYAPGLKTLEDATEIRRRILLAFELAEREVRLDNRHGPLNIVIVGGGPTGVELAGAIVEIARGALAKDFRWINPADARVILVEAAPRVLTTYPEDLSHSAEKQLRDLGVEVMLNAKVTDVGPDYIQIGSQRLSAKVILWGAGVSASPLGKKLGVPLDRAGRVIVDLDLTIPEHPEVFVVGDLASAKFDNDKPVPGVAPAAIQMGEFAARSIINDLKGDNRKPFEYRDKGSLATIGRSAAVAQFGKKHMSGFVAWLAWLFIHIFFLIGFKNRIFVFWEWAWSYFTYQRTTRLITGNTDEVAPRARFGTPSSELPVHELSPERRDRKVV